MLMIFHWVARNTSNTNIMYGKCLIGYRRQEDGEERKRGAGKGGGWWNGRRGKLKKEGQMRKMRWGDGGKEKDGEEEETRNEERTVSGAWRSFNLIRWEAVMEPLLLLPFISPNWVLNMVQGTQFSPRESYSHTVRHISCSDHFLITLNLQKSALEDIISSPRSRYL